VSGPSPSFVSLWRIAADTPSYTADDLSGAGAKKSGGRWNRRGTAAVYASESRALACLETFVHLRASGLPLNRYLVAIHVPVDAWRNRHVFDTARHVGWDAEPPGAVSIEWGDAWARGGATLVAEVPSVIVPEESNVLINPRHADASAVTARKIRKWLYDARVRSGPDGHGLA
jgi:RES domain-containing protein